MYQEGLFAIMIVLNSLFYDKYRFNLSLGILIMKDGTRYWIIGLEVIPWALGRFFPSAPFYSDGRGHPR